MKIIMQLHDDMLIVEMPDDEGRSLLDWVRKAFVERTPKLAIEYPSENYRLMLSQQSLSIDTTYDAGDAADVLDDESWYSIVNIQKLPDEYVIRDTDFRISVVQWMLGVDAVSHLRPHE